MKVRSIRSSRAAQQTSRKKRRSFRKRKPSRSSMSIRIFRVRASSSRPCRATTVKSTAREPLNVPVRSAISSSSEIAMQPNSRTPSMKWQNASAMRRSSCSRAASLRAMNRTAAANLSPLYSEIRSSWRPWTSFFMSETVLPWASATVSRL